MSRQGRRLGQSVVAGLDSRRGLPSQRSKADRITDQISSGNELIVVRQQFCVPFLLESGLHDDLVGGRIASEWRGAHGVDATRLLSISSGLLTPTNVARSNRPATSLAATRWPLWMGSNVPPTTPSLRRAF